MPRKEVRPKAKRPKPKIESQELIAETGRRAYEMLRLTRVKYQDNPYVFLDLRLFQRGYDYTTDKDVFHPTRKGVQLKEEDFQRLIGKWTLVPSLLFHPVVMKKSYPALVREEFDTAVFKAFKAVEVRVRELSRLPATLIGVALTRKAFDADNGPLADTSIPIAEREARSHLFTGAIGCYKILIAIATSSLLSMKHLKCYLLRVIFCRSSIRLKVDSQRQSNNCREP